MGMIGNYLRVSKVELAEYLENSTKLEDRVYSDTNHNDIKLIDVDKSWEGLFFLFTGKSLATSSQATAPLSWTLMAPQEIDNEQDMGYGPATYTTSEQTKEISVALNNLTLEELKARYNGQLMNDLGIYPEGWDNVESLDYLIENFISLKDFYHKASTEDEAVIIFLN